jgi:hypothetical protein
MSPDKNKTDLDMPPPRLSWYEQRRPSVGDDKSTTITLNWGKVGPMIGLVVFIGGLVTTSVNAAVSVAQYKAQIEANDRKLEEHQAKIDTLSRQVVELQTAQGLLERLQGRLAALEAEPRPMTDAEIISTGRRASALARPSRVISETAGAVSGE